jgi:transcriptional regulator with XRE-family HTH domain
MKFPTKESLDDIPEVDTKRAIKRGRGLRARRGVHMSLRSLREASGKTQSDLERLTGMHQSDISRLETREDFDTCTVETLRRYAKAIGGDVELVYVQGNDRRITITRPMTTSEERTRHSSDEGVASSSHGGAASSSGDRSVTRRAKTGTAPMEVMAYTTDRMKVASTYGGRTETTYGKAKRPRKSPKKVG